MKKFIPYGRQSIDQNDIRAVVQALKSDYLTTGPRVGEFEKKLAAYCGARYAVVCSSGTAALHLACLALGLKAEDQVITSPVTFLATANCVRYVGAEVLFSDVDANTANLDPKKLPRVLRGASKVKAVFPVHFAGQPADMEAIHKISRSHGAWVVEDAAHALGATYKTRSGRTVRVGSCLHSDMAVFSFHPVKHITTGEGGAVTTNDPRLYKRLLLFRNHGMQKKSRDPWYYEMAEVGFNYRLTDIQCALGVSQLEKAGRFLIQRRSIAERYRKAFSGRLSQWIRPLVTQKGNQPAFHLYSVRIDFKKLRVSRREFMEKLNRMGVGSQVHYIPLHLQPYYRSRYGTKPGDHPEAERFYREALSLPVFPSMKNSEINRVIQSLEKLCR